MGSSVDALFRDEEGDELVEAVVVAQHHGRLVDAGKIGELGFDLAQLHAEAANLDLVVDAAVEGDLAVGHHRHGVAGAIEDRIVAGGVEGIGDEFLAPSARRA